VYVPGFDTADNAPAAQMAFTANVNPVTPVNPTVRQSAFADYWSVSELNNVTHRDESG
jgi:hypothetical protein